MSEHVLALMIRRVLNQRARYAPFFDGVTQYGVLAQRAIDPDGDNVFEFYTPNVLSGFKTLISQNVSETFTEREFQIYTSNSGLALIRGGTLTVVANSLKPETLYGMIQNGDTIKVLEGGLGGTEINEVIAPDGGAREPDATTKVGARTNGGGITVFFGGFQYDVKINGTTWPMSTRNNPVQSSIPDGNDMTIINHTEAMWREI